MTNPIAISRWALPPLTVKLHSAGPSASKYFLVALI